MAREKKAAGRKKQADNNVKMLVAGAAVIVILAIIFWQPIMQAIQPAPKGPSPNTLPNSITLQSSVYVMTGNSFPANTPVQLGGTLPQGIQYYKFTDPSKANSFLVKLPDGSFREWMVQAATPVPSELPFWSKYPDLMAKLSQYQQPEQPSHRLCDLPPDVFSKLPAFPKDFYAMKLLFELAKIQDINYFSEDYWKQPEFYPGFDEQGCSLYQYPPRDRWAAFGYGTYPSEVVVLAKRNDEFKATFFAYTSWLVQTYQGFGFKALYPGSGSLKLNEFPDKTRVVTVDPAETQKYFQIESITPANILLEPAFPVFEKGWTQKITVTVKVTDAKPGKYLLGVDIGAPDAKMSDEWFWKYKLNYVNSGSQSIGQPWYTMFIEVQ